ncbi:MaoC/PaaZ C-terminal domain-containing protein [Salarchaeum sp. JOR-1]|uniref:MaoC family dehydratase n=1 Tax=Salarchaeum sp. JOR-1 TaxID=2599399 RepID=UPI0019819D00|nr:MaoC/PaaZ C-terminal domain-containing protein [Salarchaeum sp. JOR-1]
MTDSFAVGDTFERVTEDVSREDFVRYAGASGDFNPIHYDDPHARDAGYPSVFGQGMFTAGVASGLVRETFGLAGLREYDTRFVAQVWPGDTLTTTLEVTGVAETADGTRVEADLVVTNGDGKRVVDGGAVAVV